MQVKQVARQECVKVENTMASKDLVYSYCKDNVSIEEKKSFQVFRKNDGVKRRVYGC